MPQAEKGVRGKGRQPLSPPQHTEARSAGALRKRVVPKTTLGVRFTIVEPCWFATRDIAKRIRHGGRCIQTFVLSRPNRFRREIECPERSAVLSQIRLTDQ